ncbi:CASP-like protein 4C2 [Vitis vinifera]|uniref:CASP-like protein n=1 Tax=Vitis vinifera TaxID=29760 RepID=A0A438JY18_VITVI|nr:CASP-like protein 4C2 [Vitis vinifera]
MGASVWEISKGATVFPEILQVWFDFSHDQVFAYLLLSADAAGTALARTLKRTETCTDDNAFCVQSDIAIALGYGGFLFLGFFVPAIGLPSRLFYNQRLSFSYLEIEERERKNGGIFGCGRVYFFCYVPLCTPVFGICIIWRWVSV